MKLVIVPSESILEYENKGLTRMAEYYNPGGLFDSVFVISPLEKIKQKKYGLEIIPVMSGVEFYKKIIEIKPDVIRAYGGYWASNFVVANSPNDIPIIVSVHDTNPHLLYSGVKYFDKVICMTEAVRSSVLKNGTSIQRTTTLPNRISLSDFQDELQIKNNYFELNLDAIKYILHIGRRNHQKNLECVIKSLNYIDKNVKLISIGLGDNRTYEKIASDNNCLDRIIFIPSVPNNQLAWFFKNAMAFVLPTRWEGFGVVFIEAAASGVPIVASNIAPVNEFLKNEENSLLIDDVDDYLSLAKAINKITSDKDLQRNLSNNALKMAKNYSRERVDELEKDIYISTIKNFSERRGVNIAIKYYLAIEIKFKQIVHKVDFHIKRLGMYVFG